MKLKFTKMHGAGNDFVVIDATSAPLALDAGEIRRLSERHVGIGFDQMLVVETPRRPDTDFYYRIFNADGGEVGQCGNGARCFVRYVHDKGLSSKKAIRVETRSGIIEPRLEQDGRVTVNMGAPEFEPAKVPFSAGARALVYPLDVDGIQREVSALSMGNPHAVQVVADVEAAPVSSEGPLIERHPRFPERTNAGFMQIVDRRRIKLRVFERGAGETLSCGTGACAAVVAGIARGMLDSPVTVETRGGALEIAWEGEGRPVSMTGPAQSVFEGEIDLQRKQ
ncbi:MAG TPA: diaminopimelate epimerase [Burkholderiales bacterium]|nr:diaminopimelate epimerase [Burkholderiales bacterium]